jgi:hypothetical protein
MRMPVIAFLAKSEPDVQPFWSVQQPNYAHEFPLADAPFQTWPEWSWVPYKRQFEPTAPELVTDELRAKSALCVKKCFALWEMITSISTARALLFTGVLLQESVHLTKKAQAQAFRDAGYPQGRLHYPYVLQYADAVGTTMRQAADEILLKAQLDDEVLARTEAIRLKYFDLVKTAQLDTIAAIVKDFRVEMHKR